MGVLLLTLVATMTLFVADPDIAHAQTTPQLGSLAVGGNAIEGFASGNYDYTTPVRVSSTTSSVTVSAGAGSGSRVQEIKYAPESVNFTANTRQMLAGIPGTAASGNVVPLRSAGTTNIAVVVVEGSNPNDGTVYVVRVTRVASDAANDANLDTLAITGVATGATLVPDFDADTTSYSLFVPYDVDDSGNDGSDEIVITAMASDDAAQTVSVGASLKITPDDSDTGANGHQVELAEGRNVITVTVEAANVATKKTYTVTVTRAAANSSDDARLRSLTVGGETVPAANIELADGADEVVDYTTKVSFATESVQVRAVKMHSGAEVVIRTADSAANADAGAIDPDGRVSLTAGTPMFIAVQVTAEDGKSENRRNYILEVMRVASNAESDADLTALTITNPTVALVPGFGSGTTRYTAFVPYDIDGATPQTVNDEITVTPTRSDTDNATVKIASTQDSEIGPDNVVELAVGQNVITLTVRAADVVTTKRYTLTVTRAAESGSDEARLSALMVGGENVSVAGLDATDQLVDYTANVRNTTASIRIAATPMHGGAVVVIRTGTDAAGAIGGDIDPDGRVDLTAGTPMFIAVQVTAADGSTTHNYILQVTRVLPGASTNAGLTGLSITDPVGTDVAPAFDEDTTSYTAFVPHDVDANENNPTTGTQDEITLMVTPATGATVKITPDDSDTTAGADDHQVELAEGPNVITIMVTAADAIMTKTYTLRVTRAAANASDDARLSTLMVGGETVPLPLPEFDPTSATTTTYVSGVPNAVNTIQVAATAMHTGATVVIRTAATAAGAVEGTIDADGAMPLIVGYENFIAIQVIAEDGTTDSNKTYMLQVNRAPAGASSDAKLSALEIDQGVLSPTFDADTMAYTADVMESVESIEVMASGFGNNDNAADNDRATVRIMSDTDADIGNDSGDGLNVATHDIELMSGANVITIMVTAADYSEMETYTVTVTRAAGEDTLLSTYDTDGDGDIDLS